jgi:hypothetical protein
MTARASRIRRLERTVGDFCRACADWPTSVELTIVYRVISAREQAQQAMARVRDDDRDDPCQLGPCEACGRVKRVPVSKIRYRFEEAERGDNSL